MIKQIFSSFFPQSVYFPCYISPVPSHAMNSSCVLIRSISIMKKEYKEACDLSMCQRPSFRPSVPPANVSLHTIFAAESLRTILHRASVCFRLNMEGPFMPNQITFSHKGSTICTAIPVTFKRGFRCRSANFNSILLEPVSRQESKPNDLLLSGSLLVRCLCSWYSANVGRDQSRATQADITHGKCFVLIHFKLLDLITLE